MSLATRVLARVMKLPPAETHDIGVERNLQIEMTDGVVLLADRYFPRALERRPTVLVRSPYGRSGFWGFFFGRLVAERGFQVLVQSCRGTFDSGGEFEPFENEKHDGLATVRWMERQPWFSGSFGTLGPSYLGFAQWAIAREAGPSLKAMAVQITASQFRDHSYPGESFALDTALSWTYLMSFLKAGFLSRESRQRANKVAHGTQQLPLSTADETAIGRRRSFFQDWLKHNEPGAAYWKTKDFRETVADVTAPVQMVGGWYDIFLPWMLQDYERLRLAGRPPQLQIGPWTHVAIRGFVYELREAIAWLRAQLLNDRSKLRATPVRLYIMGANEWRDFQQWPPASAQPQRWHLQAERSLATMAPTASQPDRYRYDPADPTPSAGGALLTTAGGPVDNRQVEARADVLCYSSEVLKQSVTAIGPVSVELFVKSSLQHTDFHARLCDVRPNGASINVCDGLTRIVPGRGEPQSDGTLKVAIQLWPTAYCFLPGHRLRLQVSSGAHPRFARNPGSGEPLANASTLRTAEQEIFHDPQHPSALTLHIVA